MGQGEVPAGRILDATNIPHPFGVRLIAIGVLLLIGGALLLDLWLDWNRYYPIGYRGKTWAKRYPGFMAALALVIGMMIGHFFMLPST